MEVELQGRLLLGGAAACVLKVGIDDGQDEFAVVGLQLVASHVVAFDTFANGSVLFHRFGRIVHTFLDVPDALTDDPLGTCSGVLLDLFRAWHRNGEHQLSAVRCAAEECSAVDAPERRLAGFKNCCCHFW